MVVATSAVAVVESSTFAADVASIVAVVKSSTVAAGVASMVVELE